MKCPNCKKETHMIKSAAGDDGSELIYCNYCPRSVKEKNKNFRNNGVRVIYRPHFGAPRSVRQKRFDRYELPRSVRQESRRNVRKMKEQDLRESERNDRFSQYQLSVQEMMETQSARLSLPRETDSPTKRKWDDIVPRLTGRRATVFVSQEGGKAGTRSTLVDKAVRKEIGVGLDSCKVLKDNGFEVTVEKNG